MKYILIIAVWFSLSLIWGVLGAAYGPGIVMLIEALLVGTLGSIVMLAGRLLDFSPALLLTTCIVTAGSILVSWMLIFRFEMSGIELMILVGFVGSLAVFATLTEKFFNE
jgi:hypothetical protein